MGFEFDSPDYRHQPNPEERVEQLVSMDFSAYDQVVLIGSSMGGYVATVASARLKICGLFLLAPAFYLPGYLHTDFRPPADRTVVFHGWRDCIVPPENSWRFCKQHSIRLIMVNSDHRLLSELPRITFEFEQYLKDLSNSR